MDGNGRLGSPQAGLRDRQEGGRIYHLLSFSADGETLDEISRVLKIDDDVMRHLATRRYKAGSTSASSGGRPGTRGCPEPIDTSLEEE